MRGAQSSAYALGFLGTLVFLGASVFGAGFVSVDENGNGVGTAAPGALLPDPGPGGLPSVLTYALPFGVVSGDVLMHDADLGGSFVLDVVRFNQPNTLLFYSDNVGGVDSLGDTPSPPGANYTNIANIDELGTEADNGAFYTPLPGQPGFDLSGAPTTYELISDGAGPPTGGAPLPSSAWGGSMLLIGLGLWTKFRRSAGGALD